MMTMRPAATCVFAKAKASSMSVKGISKSSESSHSQSTNSSKHCEAHRMARAWLVRNSCSFFPAVLITAIPSACFRYRKNGLVTSNRKLPGNITEALPSSCTFKAQQAAAGQSPRTERDLECPQHILHTCWPLLWPATVEERRRGQVASPRMRAHLHNACSRSSGEPDPPRLALPRGEALSAFWKPGGTELPRVTHRVCRPARRRTRAFLPLRAVPPRSPVQCIDSACRRYSTQFAAQSVPRFRQCAARAKNQMEVCYLWHPAVIHTVIYVTGPAKSAASGAEPQRIAEHGARICYRRWLEAAPALSKARAAR